MVEIFGGTDCVDKTSKERRFLTVIVEQVKKVFGMTLHHSQRNYSSKFLTNRSTNRKNQVRLCMSNVLVNVLSKRHTTK